ncbi:hypothetical protein LTS18_007620 [Coniosporium uncinatum]|uniref:Uncharacterized protein n=1 Tax=Coniosporium uncinatum TaxID=93489 RepID=A0ACC3D2C3_9PEZI|nr:hypothetical protein LTS18_007620 [Coniosporium uncinatum]
MDVHVISMVNAVFISSLDSYILFTDPARKGSNWQQRLWGYNRAIGTTQAITAGYFLWDVLLSTMHIDVFGADALGHAVAALLNTLVGFRPFANHYGISFILYELSTPFLNIHWFCDKLDLTGSTIQLYNGFALLATFFGSRLVRGTYQSVLIYQDVWQAWNYTAPARTGFGNFSPNAVRLEQYTLPGWLGLMYVGANTVLCGLNFWWFGKMIQAVRKRFTLEANTEQAKGQGKN